MSFSTMARIKFEPNGMGAFSDAMVDLIKK
jgi:hypothetical protein